MAVTDLSFEKFLGKGSYGSVSLFTYKRQHDVKTHYAAFKTSDQEHAESLYREFRILSELKGCSRIVECYGNRVLVRLNDEGSVEYILAMEYASEGSLRSFINRFKDKKLPEPLIIEFTRMILEGLAAIHERGYVHCDLKPENILVFPRCVYEKGEWKVSYELKISDFGLSRRDGDSGWWQPHHRYVGTPIYMSPESVSHGQTGKALDLWSLGCVVLEMFTGKKPWWHTNYDLKDLKKCYEPLVPKDLPCDAWIFIMTCFALEIEDRRDALTLLRHSFVREDVSEMTKVPMNVMEKKEENPRQFAVELEKIRQKLSEIRSICV